MEFLLIAIVDLAAPLSALSLFFTLDLLVVAVDGVAFLAEALLRLLSGRARSSGKTASDPEAIDPLPIRRKSSWRRRILLAALAVFALLLAGVWMADRFYFEPIMRWGAARLEKSAGVAVDFKDVSGSLWTGEIHFTDLAMKRDSHPVSTFDVAVDRVDMRVSVVRLLWRQLRLESLAVDGARGTWTRLAKAESGGVLRTFSISDFRLDDFRIDYHNRLAGPGALPVEIRVESMQSLGLSSRWLILQLLFVSRVTGSIDGAPFLVRPDTKTLLDVTTTWKCDGLPLPVLASLVGRPFTMFERGRVDVFIENSVYFRPEFALVMDWNVILGDFAARVPPGATLKEKAVYLPVVSYLNLRKKSLNLAFKARLAKKNSSIATSDDLESSLDLGAKVFEALKGRGPDAP